MRQARWLVALVLLTVASQRALGDEQPASPPAPPPTQFSTKVVGTVPDLTGRWLMVANLAVPGGGPGVVPITLGFDVTRSSDSPKLTARWGGLPPAVKASVDAAYNARQPWEPTPEQLNEVRDQWTTISPDHPPVASYDTTITGSDAFDDVAKKEEKMKDSLFIMQLVTNFVPGGGNPVKDVMVLGARDRLPEGYGGNYASATLAAAPFPVSVAFNGTFKLYRLTAAPERGWLVRLLDVFRGCGRREAEPK